MLELILYFQSILASGLAIYAIIEIKSIQKSSHKVIMPTSMVSQVHASSPRTQMFDKKLNEASGSNEFLDLDEDELI